MTQQSAAYRAAEPTHPFAPGSALNGSLLSVFTNTGEAYAKAWLEWQQELMRFVSSRLQWDGRVGEALAKCKTLSDVVEVQKDWAMTTAQDYFDEVSRLTQIATKCVPSWMPLATARNDDDTKAEARAAE